MFVLVSYRGPDNFCTVGPFKTADDALKHAHAVGPQYGASWKFQMLQKPIKVKAPRKPAKRRK